MTFAVRNLRGVADSKYATESRTCSMQTFVVLEAACPRPIYQMGSVSALLKSGPNG